MELKITGAEMDAVFKRVADAPSNNRYLPKSEIEKRIATTLQNDGLIVVGPGYSGCTITDKGTEFLNTGGYTAIEAKENEKAALETRRLKLDVRNGEWENRRYWITTGIALLAFFVSVFALLGKC